MEHQNLISVIIPALNEELGIKKTLLGIPKKELSDHGYDLEILVIDGNSNDLTRHVAEKLGAKVIIETRKGYGRAYKTGLREAKGCIVVTLDADGTYPASLIPNYIKQLKERTLDFITVNRFSRMEDNAMAFSHRIGNKLLTFVVFLLYSVKIKDSQSGMWVMSKKFLDEINLQSDDFSLSEEIKIIAFKFFAAVEVDGVYYRRIGKLKLATIRDGWRNLKYLFKYKLLVNNALRPPLKPFQKEVTS
jgi:glycosyltransferase involved in cell wall biosynthesis